MPELCVALVCASVIQSRVEKVVLVWIDKRVVNPKACCKNCLVIYISTVKFTLPLDIRLS
jgi:hypothetical protein